MTEAEWLVQGLRDAHDRQERAQTILSAPAERIGTFPEPERRICRQMAVARVRPDRLHAVPDLVVGR